MWEYSFWEVEKNKNKVAYARKLIKEEGWVLPKPAHPSSIEDLGADPQVYAEC